MDAHGNDLQVGTNCLGHFLLYQLLEPILRKTAAVFPAATVRVAWAASIAVEVRCPKPHGMELDETGRPLDKGLELNYGQTKVGNVFFARLFARETPQNGIVHVAFNPGNLKTELQRHWQGLGPLIAVSLSPFPLHPFLPPFLTNPCPQGLLILQPAIKGAYTELYTAISPDITTEQTGAYVIPYGKIGSLPPGIETAIKGNLDGDGEKKSVAERFVAWCEQQTVSFR